MFWKNIPLIPLVLVALVFSRNKENQVKVNFSGYDRGLTTINWNGVAVDFSAVNKAAFDAGYIEDIGLLDLFKKLTREHRGSMPVFVHVGEQQVMVNKRYWITDDALCLGKIENLLGASHVWVA